MLYLAVLRAGYVYLPLNTAYQASEIEYFINNAEPSVMVCSEKNFSWVSKIAFMVGTRYVFTLNDDRTGSLLARASYHRDLHAPAPKSADQLAAIVYTSGTTGRSKGAMLSHGNLLSNALTLKHYWGWRSGDVLVHALPIFHVHGLFVAIHGALLNGSKMLWMSRFNPLAVALNLDRASVFMGVPTMYVRLLGEAALTRDAARNVRLFVSGSAPLQIETFNQFREHTGHTIVERYGMSETLMLTSNPYDTTQGERRGGSVGFALPGVGVRVHSASDEPCAADEVGNIEVRGPNVFGGYWRMPQNTAEDFSADGWFRTGDVGRLDEQGRLTIVGRSKDLIITGGFNVYPAEVEGYLNEAAGVADSAAIGVPHPDFGEAVVALVVPRPGVKIVPEQLIATLKERIANYKVPKQLFVVDDLPRNAMGKVQKNLLREQHQRLFER